MPRIRSSESELMPRLWDTQKKAKYLYAHLKNIDNRQPIGVGKVETGMLVEAFYDPEGKDAKPERFVLLVLNPLKKKKMHAISLGDIPLTDWYKLYNQVGIALNGTYKDQGIDIKCIYTPEPPKLFYANTIAVRLKKIANLSGSYRTMWITRFKRLNVCNYSFNRDIIERDLPKLFLQEKLDLMPKGDPAEKELQEKINNLPPDRLLRNI